MASSALDRCKRCGHARITHREASCKGVNADPGEPLHCTCEAFEEPATCDMGSVSKATKNDTGKVRLELLPAPEMIELGWVYTSGAAQYGDRNYLEGVGLNPDRLFGAVQRHLLAWKSGQQFDPDTGHSHLMHAAAGLFMIRELENR
jgi:hypothetical protein